MHYFMSFIISGHMSYPSVSTLKKCLKFSNISVNEKASVITDIQNVCFPDIVLSWFLKNYWETDMQQI